MSTVTDLVRQLVPIPSHDDERAAGDAVAEWLRTETEASVHRDEAGNVIARHGTGASLALVGHHDVVPPADRQVAERDAAGEPTALHITERDGRLYGRGTADMKGALAAALVAFRDADPDCELVLASFAGEEQGGLGAQAAIEAGFAPDYALVTEGSTGYSAPGVTDVAVAHKGRRGSTLTVRGSAAHASVPEAGENAVYRACDAIDVVRDLSHPETTVLGHHLQGSLAVTEIEGGEAWNVIPDQCVVTVDERTVPGQRADLDQVETLPGVEWTVDQDLPPMRCDEEGFAETVLAAADTAQDSDPTLITKPHATDAGWLAGAGTTCVVCGAAEPGEAHTDEESVAIDVLKRCADIYRTVAETM